MRSPRTTVRTTPDVTEEAAAALLSDVDAFNRFATWADAFGKGHTSRMTESETRTEIVYHGGKVVGVVPHDPLYPRVYLVRDFYDLQAGDAATRSAVLNARCGIEGDAARLEMAAALAREERRDFPAIYAAHEHMREGDAMFYAQRLVGATAALQVPAVILGNRDGCAENYSDEGDLPVCVVAYYGEAARAAWRRLPELVEDVKSCAIQEASFTANPSAVWRN